MFEQPLKIRDYRQEDFGTLHEMDRICFPGHIAYSRKELLFCLNHPESIARIAELHERIAGFVLVRVEGRRLARIITLDVDPGVRRRGIGTLLMQEVHNLLESRGIVACILEVAAGNLHAQRLYERMQYRREETLPGYYGGRENALRMVRFFRPV